MAVLGNTLDLYQRCRLGRSKEPLAEVAAEEEEEEAGVVADFPEAVVEEDTVVEIEDAVIIKLVVEEVVAGSKVVGHNAGVVNTETILMDTRASLAIRDTMDTREILNMEGVANITTVKIIILAAQPVMQIIEATHDLMEVGVDDEIPITVIILTKHKPMRSTSNK